jgi:hypothetical protein
MYKESLVKVAKEFLEQNHPKQILMLVKTPVTFSKCNALISVTTSEKHNNTEK